MVYHPESLSCWWLLRRFGGVGGSLGLLSLLFLGLLFPLFGLLGFPLFPCFCLLCLLLQSFSLSLRLLFLPLLLELHPFFKSNHTLIDPLKMRIGPDNLFPGILPQLFSGWIGLQRHRSDVFIDSFEFGDLLDLVFAQVEVGEGGQMGEGFHQLLYFVVAQIQFSEGGQVLKASDVGYYIL